MTAFPRLTVFAVALLSLFAAILSSAQVGELVRVDTSGVIRWVADQQEVALFGANYCLPSASDYRAAGYLGSDRRRLIERDLTHFARMGWDGLRLTFWGDWENCDREGNLIANDHLDLLDYLIFQAKQRGIFMLFSPIQRHSALWSDGQDSDAVQGFSKYFRAAELGTNPAAIAAQQNYLRQILHHVNPYTGVALKDEPAILFVELINEPEHHANDTGGSIAYINALSEAVRSTGCQKIIFHNLSQDFAMAPAIAASKAQGFSLGWYPTSLLAGRTLGENYLRWADGYTPLLEPGVPSLPRIVYEFDSADMISGYMYPAMVRAFREVGVQFAAMFAYDMLDTAPFNLGWQTHFLNLVYSPRKAVSAIIAAEAMRTLPRGGHYGRYPDNRRFGPFRVSYEEDSSEFVTAEKFLYANSTTTRPTAPATLRQIVGTGRSSVVSYDGTGSYFLDQIDAGRWRLEVYPDAVLIRDPFARRLDERAVCSRLLWRTWPMQINLPDLGAAFSIVPLDHGNPYRAQASDGSFSIRPGVYLLTRPGASGAPLPARIGFLGIDEFVCPPATDLPLQVVPHLEANYVAGQTLDVTIDVLTPTAPQAVHLHVQGASDDRPQTFVMSPTLNYGYRGSVPAGAITKGHINFAVSVELAGRTESFPSAAEGEWRARVVSPTESLALLDPAVDQRALFTLRSPAMARRATHSLVAATTFDPAFLHVQVPKENIGQPYALSLPVKTRVKARGASVREASALQLVARGEGTPVTIALVEADGTTWTACAALTPDWSTITLPLREFRIGAGLKLPLGYPGEWNLTLPPPDHREPDATGLNIQQVEHLQLCLSPPREHPPSTEWQADIAAVTLEFEAVP